MKTYLKLHSTLRIADLAGVSNRMIDFLESNDLTPYPEYDIIIPQLKTHTEALTDAMDRDKLKSDLANLDAERDDALRNLGAVLKGYAHMPDESTSTAAQALYEIYLRHNPKLARARYDAESGKIESLLLELAQPENIVWVQSLLQLEETIKALQDAQDAFEQAKIAYTKAKELRKENSKSASEHKPQLLYVINQLLVNYHAGMVPFRDENFLNIANTINNWIKDANANV